MSTNRDPHGGSEPSRWVERFAPLIPERGLVLDLACGGGRHTRFLIGRGHRVVALDRDVSNLGDLSGNPQIETVEADLENGSPWPLADRRFSGIVVTNYLFRPLLPTLVEALSEDGVFLYETFAVGNERFGKPSNPAFLLAPSELLEVVRNRLRVVAYEEGRIDRPRAAVVQRICAVRTSGDATPPRL